MLPIAGSVAGSRTCGVFHSARALASDGGALLNLQEEHGWTPLHNAAALPDASVRLQLAQLLVQRKADLLRADLEGYTCLHWAAACGHLDVLELPQPFYSHLLLTSPLLTLSIDPLHSHSHLRCSSCCSARAPP